MEAINGECPDFEAPSIAPLMEAIGEVIGKTLKGQLKLFSSLWETFVRKLSVVMVDQDQLIPAIVRALKSVAGTMFRTIENFTMLIYDILIVLVREIRPILTGRWKLGAYTDMWEDMTGQEFTIMNVLTYPLALLLNILAIGSSGRLPSKDRQENLKAFDFDSVPIKPLYGSKRGVRLSTTDTA